MQHASKKIFLHPGDFCFSKEPVHVHTLLGSCISITLWHPELHIGGMCHFTLPKYPGKPSPDRKPDGRYADDVMKMFREETARCGTRLTEYEAKIFGGGNMMREEGQCVQDSIGSKNAAMAMQLLMQENVNILVAHVGEFGHRRLVFDIGTGDVWVRHTESGGVRRQPLNGKV